MECVCVCVCRSKEIHEYGSVIFSLFLVHLLHSRDCVYMWMLLTFKSRVVCVLYISIMADGTSIVGI